MSTPSSLLVSVPRQVFASPSTSSIGGRCWKLLLLTIVTILLAQIFLYYNGSSFYDIHRLSALSSSSLQVRWFSNHSAAQSSVLLSLDGDGDSDSKPSCPPYPPNLKGRVQVNLNPPSLKEQERAHPELTLGGHYLPRNCTARHKVAIIIPYRDRETHLTAFIHHMHPFLQRQQLEYNIYVVEQADTGSFNRGMLMNVGVLEALRQFAFDCLLLHDVDLLPEDDRNLYTCSKSPRHMAVSINTYGYRLLYENNFGGVCAMTTKQFTAINGFSNRFWGWGGEDDDLFNRVKHLGLKLSRYSSEVGRYTMLSHKKAKPNPDRFKKLQQGRRRFKKDGLNSTKYQILKSEQWRLFTLLFVALERS